jgi:tetratricopeptide (TPR) repeat protein
MRYLIETTNSVIAGKALMTCLLAVAIVLTSVGASRAECANCVSGGTYRKATPPPANNGVSGGPYSSGGSYSSGLNDAGIALGAAGAVLGILGALAERRSNRNSGGGSQCSSGYGRCPDQTCAPMNSVCCGNGLYCPGGTSCTRDNKCVSNAALRRYRECESLLATAQSEYETGYNLFKALKPAEALPHYVRSISLFKKCGNSAHAALIQSQMSKVRQLRECESLLATADSEYETGYNLFNALKPTEALPHFERSISLLKKCGNSAQAARIQSQMSIVRQRADAEAPDNRVNQALKKFGAPEIDAPNPFSGQSDAPVFTHWIKPIDLDEEARLLCSADDRRNIQREVCIAEERARIILREVPEIGVACNRFATPPEIVECVNTQYAAIANSSFNVTGEGNEYVQKMPADTRKAPTKRNALDRLRAKISKKADVGLGTSDDEFAGENLADDAEADDLIVGDALIDVTEERSVSSVAVGNCSISDDPLQAFLCTRNAQGSTNGGDLIMDGAVNVGVPQGQGGSFANEFFQKDVTGGEVKSLR